MNIDIKNLYELLIEFDLYQFFKDADYETTIVAKLNNNIYNLSNILQKKYLINDIDWILRVAQYLAKYGIIKTEKYIENINMLKDEVINAYHAVDCLLLWDFLKDYEPSKDTGFMFDTNKNMNLIWKKMESLNIKIYNMHSGSSMAFTMRAVQYIAKNSLDKYLLEKNN
jgi:hypothetical protein